MAESVQNLNPEEGNLQNGENPLLNSLVMENVFSFMESTVSVKDLKNFRLVYQVWSESSLKVWRKVARLRLGPPEMPIRTRSQALSSHPPAGSYLPVNKFLEMMTNSSRDLHQFQQKPFSNLVLLGIDFIRNVPTCLKQFSTGGLGDTNLWNYLNNGKNHVKSFSFQGCSFTRPAFAVTCLRKLGVVEKVAFVNTQWEFQQGNKVTMRRLFDQWSLQDSPVKELEVSGDAMRTFFLFMTACHSLEKLTVRCNYHKPRLEFTLRHLLACLRVSSCANVPKRFFELKELDALESRFFNCGYDVSGLERLLETDVHFPLELLTLTLEPGFLVGFRNIFHPLIKLFESTLKTLKVFRAPIDKVIPNNLPLFPGNMLVLEELHLYGNMAAGFGFLEQTPNLKVLHIDTRCPFLANHMEKLYFPNRTPAKLTWFRDRYQPHCEDLLNGTTEETRLRLRLEHMTDLHLECNLTPETIQFLGRCMPNLKVFKGIMTNDVWKAVCQWMPALEEVGILRGSQVGEEALTGCYNSDGGVAREPLSILRLNNLRRFVYMAYCGQSSIGDLAVRRGLLEMPRLGMVLVCVNKQFSVEAGAALKEGILSCTIVRNTNETCRGGWDCCEEFNFLREFNN